MSREMDRDMCSPRPWDCVHSSLRYRNVSACIASDVLCMLKPSTPYPSTSVHTKNSGYTARTMLLRLCLIDARAHVDAGCYMDCYDQCSYWRQKSCVSHHDHASSVVSVVACAWKAMLVCPMKSFTAQAFAEPCACAPSRIRRC